MKDVNGEERQRIKNVLRFGWGAYLTDAEMRSSWIIPGCLIAFVIFTILLYKVVRVLEDVL